MQALQLHSWKLGLEALDCVVGFPSGGWHSLVLDTVELVGRLVLDLGMEGVNDARCSYDQAVSRYRTHKLGIGGRNDGARVPAMQWVLVSKLLKESGGCAWISVGKGSLMPGAPTSMLLLTVGLPERDAPRPGSGILGSCA